jgi:hypothetical protein
MLALCIGFVVFWLAAVLAEGRFRWRHQLGAALPPFRAAVKRINAGLKLRRAMQPSAVVLTLDRIPPAPGSGDVEGKEAVGAERVVPVVRGCGASPCVFFRRGIVRGRGCKFVVWCDGGVVRAAAPSFS